MIKSWSKQQTVIALSSGEAELYAAGRGAREGIGMQSIARELGYDMAVETHIDASAAEGMMQRRGLGKLRHVEVQELWVQHANQRGKFVVRKIGSKDNASDIGTKPLKRESLEHCLELMGITAPICS